VPLPGLPAVTRRVGRIARASLPFDGPRVRRSAAVLLLTAPRPVAAKAAEWRSSPDDVGAPDEVAALLDLASRQPEDPGARAERARRNASVYLRERRRRLRRELGTADLEEDGPADG
jgi:hypothetical protein